MSAAIRALNIFDSLKTLVSAGVKVRSVLDVGVLEHTRPLMSLFPDVKHLLFEPVEQHYAKIVKNYSALDYELHRIALSSMDGEGYIVNQSNNYSGEITHSHFSRSPVDSRKDKRIVGCDRVRVAKLDTVLSEHPVATPYLLKIDVDGHELEILKGARDSLNDASIVVIEAPVNTNDHPFMERAQFLVDRGFYLYDIVGFLYYAKVLHQVDLVFIRSDIYDGTDALRPRETGPIDPALWFAPSFN